MPSLKRFSKQPAEKLDYDVDYEDFFGTEDDDDIDGSANVSASIRAPGGSAPHLELDGPPIAIGGLTSRRAKVWLKGGVDGTTYHVTVIATTHQGRIVEADFLITVKEL